jgi:hypothetical protein
VKRAVKCQRNINYLQSDLNSAYSIS